MLYTKKDITKQDLLTGYDNIKLIINKLLDDWKVSFKASNKAPNTCTSMMRTRRDKGYFIVYNGGDHGYLGKEHNIKFRALHDYMHFKYGYSFSFVDEKKLSDLTVRLFSKCAWDRLNLTSWECFVVRCLINCEIKGQIEYFEKHKK